jgi:hypothetical protein
VWAREDDFVIYHYSLNEYQKVFSIGFIEFDISGLTDVSDVWLRCKWSQRPQNQTLIITGCEVPLCTINCNNADYMAMATNLSDTAYGTLDSPIQRLNNYAVDSLQKAIDNEQTWWALAIMWECPFDEPDEAVELSRIRLKAK